MIYGNKYAGIRDYLAKFLLSDAVRWSIHGKFYQVAKAWYIKGGGNAEDFEKLWG